MERWKIPNNELTIIAEIGINHEGDADVAKSIIIQLEGSGVAAVKLQSFTPERYASASDPERLQRLRSFHLSLEEHHELQKEAHRVGLAFISTPASEDWVQPLSTICDAIKIASGDIDFAPTITAAAESGLPVIMSTGTATIEEVDFAVNLFKTHNKAIDIKDHLFLMHCVSEYPATIEECNIRSITYMRERYGLHVGWSNHVIGRLACYSAVATGANLIEIHVTDKREGRQFRDHALSFEAAELKDLFIELKQIKNCLGKNSKKPTNSEIKNRNTFRKGLIYARSLKAGSVIAEQDINFARPAIHFRSFDKHRVVGKRLAKDVEVGHLITPNELLL